MAPAGSIGPIARKIIGSITRVRREKIVDLEAWREGAATAAAINEGAKVDVKEMGPAFGAYLHVTNWALGLLEVLQNLRELAKLSERIAQAEEEYMPQGPPMSPLTRSYFWSWCLWDMTTGTHRETFGSVLLAVARFLNMDATFVAALANLCESRLGVYAHQGVAGGRGDVLSLRELVTDEKHECVCPSGYRGDEGELWLARVLPAPFPELTESVVTITPYVLIRPGKQQWREYFDRNLPKTKVTDRVQAYCRLMKFGLSFKHWPEFIFEAYANHQPEAVFLAGLPDVDESRPHSQVNEDRWT